MGIIAQTTENIKLHKVIATPRRDLGRILSTGADSTHFVNCAMPIISEGDIVGCVASLCPAEKNTMPDPVEIKLVQTAAGFLGRQLEG